MLSKREKINRLNKWIKSRLDNNLLGKEQFIDLLATRIEVAEARLQNKIDVDLHGDGERQCRLAA